MTGDWPAAVLAWPLVAAVPIGLVAGLVARWAAEVDGRRQGLTPLGHRVLVDAVAVVATVLVVARFGWAAPTVPAFVVVTALVATGVTDLRSHRIPDRVVGPALVACLVLMAVIAATVDQPKRLLVAGVGAALFGGLLSVIRLAMPHGIGLGDVKLGVLLGATIGWFRPTSLVVLEHVVWSLLLASALGLVIALVRHGRARPCAVPLLGQRIPFGPLLSVATVGMVGLGDLLVR